MFCANLVYFGPAHLCELLAHLAEDKREKLPKSSVTLKMANQNDVGPDFQKILGKT